MTIRERIETFWGNKVVRSVGVLVGGTAFAHGITALSLPIVTRLYTPADFSVLAVFASLLSILSVAACLRFDLAIPIPEQDAEAMNLLALALGGTVIVAAMVAAAELGLSRSVANAFRQPALARWLWMLPIGILLAGAYSALQSWFVRRKAFGSIAQSRVTQSAAAASVQVGMGWIHWTPVGLIVGQLLNTGAGCANLGYRFLRHERSLLGAITWSGMRAGYSKYDRFPKYSTFEALSNVAGMQLPIIIIAAQAAGPEAGFLMLAMSAMQAPMSLIGNAIAQVYLSRAPDELRAGRLDAFTSHMFGGLVKTGTGPLVCAGILAPTLFSLVFGAEWHRAGVLVTWMTPWFIMQYLSVPISMALHVTGSQRVALALQILGLILRVGMVYAASVFARSLISEAFALSGFAFYAIYLVTVLRIVDAKMDAVVRETRRSLPAVVLWTAASGCLLALSSLLHSVQ